MYVYPSVCLCVCEASHVSLIYSTSNFSSLGFYLSLHTMAEPYFEILDKCHLLISSQLPLCWLKVKTCKPQTFWLSTCVVPQTGCVSFSRVKGKLCQLDEHFIVSTCKPLLETNHKTNGQGRVFLVGSFFISLCIILAEVCPGPESRYRLTKVRKKAGLSVQKW